MSVNGSSAGSGGNEFQGDLELVRAAVAGHRTSIDALLARMVCIPRFLLRFNARQAKGLDHAALQDAGQETAARVWRDLGRYAGRSKFESWTYTYARNVFLETLRADRERREDGLDLAAFVESEDTDVVRHASDREEARRVLQRVDALPDSAAEVVRARLLDGESFRSMAERLNEPVETVRARFYRAIKKVAEALTGAADGEPKGREECPQ